MFTITDQQFDVLRQRAMAEGLIRSFDDSTYRAARDAQTGDVLVKDARGHTTRVSFDQQGFIGGVTSPLGRRWRLENNPEGKLTGITNPAGLKLGVEYGSAGEVTRVTRQSHDFFDFSYHGDGQLAKVVHPDHTTTRLEYQTEGKLTAFTNRLGDTEQYEYDPAGNLIGIQDGDGNRTQFRYSVWNRPDTLEYPDGSRERYEYSPWGFVSRIVTGQDNVAEIENDGQGRPVKIRYSDGESLSFARDSEGRVLEARNAEIAVKYMYDAEGRVTEEDQGGQVIKYQYDAAGVLTGLVYPSGETVEFGYDADLRLASVKDWNDGAHNFAYSRDDRSFTHHLPNALVARVRQSAAGLPLAITVAKVRSISAELPSSARNSAELPSSMRRGPGGGEAANLFSLEYQYDEEDRVHAFTDSEFGSRQYFYDPEGQLVSVKASDPEKAEDFAYDPAGNRLRATGAEAEFNSLNQLVSQGNIRCDYDAAGNMTSLERSEGSWRFSWNSRNLLVRAEGPDGVVVTFGYDAFGRRIWKRGPGGEVRFIWAGEQMVREIVRDETGTHTRDYLYYPGTYTPLALRVDGKVYDYHTDHLGTPRRLTDSEGQVVWSADYSAFGRVQTKVKTISNPLRFPGQYFDPETGLHYNRFRYYSPALGRYLSRDPVSFLAGLNVYWYLENSPTNSADPLGLWTWKTAVAIAAGVVVAAAVVALAPIALPLAIIAGGALAGAVTAGLNEALNNGLCWPCIAQAALKGAFVGIIAALPFAFLPAAAGVLAYAGTGGLSGGLGYAADFFANYPNATWNWGHFATAVGIGAATAGLGRFLGPRIAAWREGPSAQEEAQTYAALLKERGETPGAVSAAVNKRTGEVFLEKSGNPPSNVAPQLKAQLPPKSLRADGLPPENCAEFKAANTALLADPNAQLSDLEIHTVRPRTGLDMQRCPNCQHTTAGANVTSDHD